MGGSSVSEKAAFITTVDFSEVPKPFAVKNNDVNRKQPLAEARALSANKP